MVMATSSSRFSLSGISSAQLLPGQDSSPVRLAPWLRTRSAFYAILICTQKCIKVSYTSRRLCTLRLSVPLSLYTFACAVWLNKVAARFDLAFSPLGMASCASVLLRLCFSSSGTPPLPMLPCTLPSPLLFMHWAVNDVANYYSQFSIAELSTISSFEGAQWGPPCYYVRCVLSAIFLWLIEMHSSWMGSGCFGVR